MIQDCNECKKWGRCPKQRHREESPFRIPCDDFELDLEHQSKESLILSSEVREGEIVGSHVSPEPKEVRCVNRTTATTPDSSVQRKNRSEEKK